MNLRVVLYGPNNVIIGQYQATCWPLRGDYIKVFNTSYKVSQVEIVYEGSKSKDMNTPILLPVFARIYLHERVI